MARAPFVLQPSCFLLALGSRAGRARPLLFPLTFRFSCLTPTSPPFLHVCAENYTGGVFIDTTGAQNIDHIISVVGE